MIFEEEKRKRDMKNKLWYFLFE